MWTKDDSVYQTQLPIRDALHVAGDRLMRW